MQFTACMFSTAALCVCVCFCVCLCLYACAIEPHIVYRSTSLEGHLARCRYNDAKTKEVKADPKKWEVRCRHILPPSNNRASADTLLSRSSAPTTCHLAARSFALGEPKCRPCTPCPTSFFAREALECVVVVLWFGNKNLGLMWFSKHLLLREC